MQSDQVNLPLFDVPEMPLGPSAKVMHQQINEWTAAGRAVSVIQRQTLMDLSTAIDMARLAGRSTAITGAVRVLVETLQAFGLVGESPAPITDPVSDLLQGLPIN